MNQDNAPEKQLAFEDLMRFINGFRDSRVLLTAHELGIFSLLAGGSKSAAELAAAVKGDERGVDRLLNALCAMNLLRKHEGRFSATAAATRYLTPGQPEFIGFLPHAVNLWERWSTLTDAVKQGRSVQVKNQNDPSGNWVDAFIGAMHYNSMQRSPAVVSALDLSGVGRVLDVGGGSGAFAITLARAKPAIKAVVFDLPEVTPLTRRYVAQEGAAASVTTMDGDFNRDPFGEGYDLVLISSIVHMNSPAENLELTAKAAHALNPGGQLVIRDHVMAEDRTTPAMGALFALNMLVGTAAGDTFTETEIGGWMAAAGLGAIHRIDIPGDVSLMVGRKPK